MAGRGLHGHASRHASGLSPPGGDYSLFLIETKSPRSSRRKAGPGQRLSAARVGIKAAGLESASSESSTVHYHAHLNIFVDGKGEPVAASIGREDQSLFSPLHTHATSGMIHIEAPSAQRITLGALFTEWGVRLTNKCVGGYCRPRAPIKAYVDGRPYPGRIAGIVLRKGEEIALVIGSKPAQIPSNWNCRANIDRSRPIAWCRSASDGAG